MSSMVNVELCEYNFSMYISKQCAGSLLCITFTVLVYIMYSPELISARWFQKIIYVKCKKRDCMMNDWIVFLLRNSECIFCDKKALQPGMILTLGARKPEVKYYISPTWMWSMLNMTYSSLLHIGEGLQTTRREWEFRRDYLFYQIPEESYLLLSF